MRMVNFWCSIEAKDLRKRKENASQQLGSETSFIKVDVLFIS